MSFPRKQTRLSAASETCSEPPAWLVPAPSSPSRDNWVLCDGSVCIAQAPAHSEGGGRAGLGETPHVAATQLGSEWPADESEARAPGSLGRTNNPTLKIGRGKSPLSRFLTPVADAFPLNLLCAFAMCVFQVASCLDASWRVARTFECANHQVCLRGGVCSQPVRSPLSRLPSVTQTRSSCVCVRAAAPTACLGPVAWASVHPAGPRAEPLR